LNKNTSMLIFEKQYDGESIVDVSRDVTEAFDTRFNPIVESITCDKYGFTQGNYTVTIIWEPCRGEINEK